MLALTIVHAFGPYRVSDEVTDPAEVERLSSGPNAQHVVRVMRPDPAPEPAAEPEKPAELPAPKAPAKADAKTDPKPAAKADDADRA